MINLPVFAIDVCSAEKFVDFVAGKILDPPFVVVLTADVELLGVNMSPNCDDDADDDDEKEGRLPVRGFWFCRARVRAADVADGEDGPKVGDGEIGNVDDDVIRRPDCGRPSDIVE